MSSITIHPLRWKTTSIASDEPVVRARKERPSRTSHLTLASLPATSLRSSEMRSRPCHPCWRIWLATAAVVGEDMVADGEAGTAGEEDTVEAGGSGDRSPTLQIRSLRAAALSTCIATSTGCSFRCLVFLPHSRTSEAVPTLSSLKESFTLWNCYSLKGGLERLSFQPLD